MKGISRSPTVVCAYLMATTNMTVPETIKHVRSLRAVAAPNRGFRQQLVEYDTRLEIKTEPKPSGGSNSELESDGTSVVDT